MQRELISELTRLVGRSEKVMDDALLRFLDVLAHHLDSATCRQLAAFPMTAWQGLLPDHPVVKQIWSAAASAGLNAEEVFTFLAIVDDHYRRQHGCHCWSRADEWIAQAVSRHCVDSASHLAATEHVA